MNQRIQELALQADLMRYPSDGINIKIEKFAELIVRECSKIADDWVNDKDNGENYPSEMIKQHFGVKE